MYKINYMNKLDSFEARLADGQEAENLFENYLKNKDIKYVRHFNESYWSKSYDLINGDFYINEEKFDIKRNSISFKSLDNYNGKYFIVYHWNLHTPIIVKADDVRKLNRSYCDILRSGDKGFKYNRLKYLKHKTLDEFFV
jgi:hypothetical protein